MIGPYTCYNTSKTSTNNSNIFVFVLIVPYALIFALVKTLTLAQILIFALIEAIILIQISALR